MFPFHPPNLSLPTKQTLPPPHSLTVMRIKIHTTLPCLILSLAALATSCSDDFVDRSTPDATHSDMISFGITDAAGWPDSRAAASTCPDRHFTLRGENSTDSLCATMTVTDFDDKGSDPRSRAALVTTESIYEKFGVSGYVSAKSETTPTWKTYFQNEPNQKPASGTGDWTFTSGHTYFWPGEAYNMRFCAYAPLSDNKNIIFNSSTNGGPLIEYIVPAGISGQVDLLAACIEKAGDNYATVPLAFDHVCTAIQFVEGPTMTIGTIKKIELENIPNNGTYSIATGEWGAPISTTATTATFTQSFGTAGKDFTQNDGTAITGDDNCLIMIPQTLPEGARMIITYNDKIAGSEKTVSASIAGHVWPKGKRVKYTLNITPDCNFTLSQSTVDAHYEILKTTLTVSGVADGVNWKITAPTFDSGESVTIQQESEMNSFAKLGYWTDSYVQGTTTKGSARGETIYQGTGSGSTNLAIFVPENAGTTDRNFTLDVTTTNASGQDILIATIPITQCAPYGPYGWEQIDDQQAAEFGFNWDERSMYVIPYDSDTGYRPWPWNIDSYQKRALDLLNSLIKQYNAKLYVNSYHVTMNKDKSLIGRYETRDTYIIVFDYSKLNLTGKTFSDTDGHTNTAELENYANGAIGKEFEHVLNAITKRSIGENKTDVLFRPISQWEVDNNQTLKWGDGANETGLFITDGTVAPGAGILRQIEKKNAYNLQATVESGETDWYPVMKELKWYLPAKNQFTAGFPSAPDSPFWTPADRTSAAYWTSNPDLTGANDRAYLGNGTTDSRRNLHNGRACRF